MSTFARIVDGVALECLVADTESELAARFHPDWFARNQFTIVPDGTIHGAVDNGDGTFSNPAPNPEPVSPEPALDPIADLRAQIALLSDAIAAAVPAAAQAIRSGEK